MSAPLRGKVAGVLAADLKLDTFNNFVQEQRPGEHGIVAIFDPSGTLIAYLDLAELIRNAIAEHPSDPQLPNISAIKSGGSRRRFGKTGAAVNVTKGISATIRDETTCSDWRNFLWLNNTMPISCYSQTKMTLSKTFGGSSSPG
jgi:hypothetical protein